MENRLRNESAFNELLEEIAQRSSSYYSSSISDLRDRYKNTNPFYLFSNQFHDLILKFMTQLQNDKKFDIRKCVKELIQELTFYKIACPLKHLRLANSNIPSLVVSMNSSPHLCEVSEGKTYTDESISQMNVIKYISDKEPERPLLASSIGATSVNNFAAEMSKLKTCESFESLQVDNKTVGTSQMIENALKSVPKGVTAVINLKISQPLDPILKNGESSSSNLSDFPSQGYTSTTKRKIGEVAMFKEEEISRKKTSNGQGLMRIRKQACEQNGSHKLQNDTVYIIDDDGDDDVIIKGCYTQPEKNTKWKPKMFIPKTKDDDLIFLKGPSHTVNGTRNTVTADDDVFIVEDVDLIYSGTESLSKNSCQTHNHREIQDEDIVILKSYKAHSVMLPLNK